MKLWTSLFQRSETCGTRSPKPPTELSIVPVRVINVGPTLAVNVPSNEVLLVARDDDRADGNWPPRTEFGKNIGWNEQPEISVGVQIRSRLTFTFRFSPAIGISLAAAMAPDADTVV